MCGSGCAECYEGHSEMIMVVYELLKETGRGGFLFGAVMSVSRLAYVPLVSAPFQTLSKVSATVSRPTTI